MVRKDAGSAKRRSERNLQFYTGCCLVLRFSPPPAAVRTCRFTCAALVMVMEAFWFYMATATWFGSGSLVLKKPPEHTRALRTLVRARWFTS
jgi:hypothetical protein